MILTLLIVGIVLIVSAFRNSQGALFSALYQDVPDFVVWAAAIFAIGAVGFIPGLKPVSRGILALVIVVIVLRNYKNIIAGFENVWTNPPKAAPADSGTNSPLPASMGGGTDALQSLFHDPMALSMGNSDFGSSAGALLK